MQLLTMLVLKISVVSLVLNTVNFSQLCWLSAAAACTGACRIYAGSMGHEKHEARSSAM